MNYFKAMNLFQQFFQGHSSSKKWVYLDQTWIFEKRRPERRLIEDPKGVFYVGDLEKDVFNEDLGNIVSLEDLDEVFFTEDALFIEDLVKVLFKEDLMEVFFVEDLKEALFVGDLEETFLIENFRTPSS